MTVGHRTPWALVVGIGVVGLLGAVLVLTSVCGTAAGLVHGVPTSMTVATSGITMLIPPAAIETPTLRLFSPATRIIAPLPTNTPKPPTNTPLPPTDTPVPPAYTPKLLTRTPALPTDTPVSATRTPVPPTWMPIEPSPAPELAVKLRSVSEARPQFPRLVLGNYFAWYDVDRWDDCNISAGDKPLQPYGSDDPATIARHVRMALDIGLDGFTVHWFAPGERMDQNFATLLARSQGTGFQSTIVFARHFWQGSPAPSQQNLVEALRYVIDRYSRHANFLHVEGKAVIFFADMYRVPVAGGQTPQQAWAAIRAQVDPNGDTWWIAEGLDPAYLAIFDGLFVYKVTHADYPDDYLKASRWASQVRQWEKKADKPKLWIATLTPGWDDLRAGCRPDVRVHSRPHKQDRADGAFYRATFNAALKSNPDWLWIHSFNEWVEGTYIEPSVFYGDKYMQMTREFVQQFKR
jgi:hypothetical protein